MKKIFAVMLVVLGSGLCRAATLPFTIVGTGQPC